MYVPVKSAVAVARQLRGELGARGLSVLKPISVSFVLLLWLIIAPEVTSS